MKINYNVFRVHQHSYKKPLEPRSGIIHRLKFRFMVFNVTLNNISVISWWSVLLMEETGVPRENHRPVESL